MKRFQGKADVRRILKEKPPIPTMDSNVFKR